MEETNVNVENKLSYEELENAANKIVADYQRLYAEYQKLNMENAFKRLDYLFKVLKYHDVLDSDFVKNCVSEIQEMMIIKDTTDNNE
jgi:vacuolar-type H+-ATPase subunit I/STV1